MPVVESGKANLLEVSLYLKACLTEDLAWSDNLIHFFFLYHFLWILSFSLQDLCWICGLYLSVYRRTACDLHQNVYLSRFFFHSFMTYFWALRYDWDFFSFCIYNMFISLSSTSSISGNSFSLDATNRADITKHRQRMVTISDKISNIFKIIDHQPNLF